MKIGYAKTLTGKLDSVTQETFIDQYAVEKFYVDKISSTSLDAPRLTDMLKSVREGDTVIVNAFSEVAYNVRVFLKIVEQLELKKVTFISIRENLDTSTSIGKFAVSILTELKQIEHENLLERQRIGIEQANHQLFTESTEEEMLISMAEPASDKADAILDRLDLLQFKERHPMALSGGQKQRVAIATALVSERKVLVLDEPTSGLDLQHMKEVADELITIQEMGKTSLVITHDYELIVSCCTHVLHLEHGVVQEQYALDATGFQLLKNFFIESR
jgi:hypothetical protein